MTTYVYCTRKSKSAYALAQALGAQRLRELQTVPFGSTIINWGDGLSCLNGSRVINPAPLTCTNKIATFNKLREHNVSIPEYTTDRNAVTRGDTWLARHSVTGSGGRGIAIINPGDPVPDAPLYTKLIPKRWEVRVHVAKGRNGPYYCFDQQQKMPKSDVPNDPTVWSHDNGYAFVRNHMSIPNTALNNCILQGLRAVKALGMDFGAVDVVHDGTTAFILEVNSAPGIEGTTLVNYVQMLRNMING